MKKILKKSLACMLAAILCLTACVGAMASVGAEGAITYTIADVAIDQGAEGVIDVTVSNFADVAGLIAEITLPDAVVSIDGVKLNDSAELVEMTDETAGHYVVNGKTVKFVGLFNSLNEFGAAFANVDTLEINIDVTVVDEAREAAPITAVFAAGDFNEGTLAVTGTDGTLTVNAVCKHTETETVIENRVEADCDTDGSYDEVVYCAACDFEISRTKKTIAALGHTEGEVVIENQVAADCVNDGSYDEVVYCTVCNEELSRETKTVDALGHEEAEAVIENNVAPDCVNAGSYDTVVYCTVCNEEISRATTTVEALGHTEETIPAVAPTCTETGLTEGKRCSVCGEVLVAQEVVEALGHTPADAVEENRVEAQPGVAGSYDMVVYCSVCNVELSRTSNEIPALPVGPVLDENIKPGTHTISTGETFGLGLRIQLDTLKDEYKSFRLDVKRTGYASGFNFAYFETSISEFSANQKFNALISKVTLYGIELFSTTAPIEYTLHCFDANGVEIAYSETFTTTLADSAIAYHDLPETKDSLKKVMADLIQVGAAALNEYTNNRTKACDYSSLPIPTIDSDFISKDLPTLSLYDWTDGSPEISVVTGVQDRAYFNLTVAADYKNEADRYHYKVYYQNKAKNDEDKTSTHYIYSGDMKGNDKTLFCSFKNIPMFATNEEVTFELYKDDVLISTRKYSIDSYIASVLEDSSKKETLKTLLREVAKLGQSFRESRGF